MCNHCLFAKRSKCFSDKPSVAYLNHIILTEGVAMDVDKVAAMEAWTWPRMARALRRFLGFNGYYRKFIATYNGVATP